MTVQIIHWPSKGHGMAILFARWNLIITWPLYLWAKPDINRGPQWDEYMIGPVLVMVFSPAPAGVESVRERSFDMSEREKIRRLKAAQRYIEDAKKEGTPMT